jgi:hypothetical protein
VFAVGVHARADAEQRVVLQFKRAAPGEQHERGDEQGAHGQFHEKP